MSIPRLAMPRLAMARLLVARLSTSPWTRRLFANTRPACASRVPLLPVGSHEPLLDVFRKRALVPKCPVWLSHDAPASPTQDLPAARKWFVPSRPAVGNGDPKVPWPSTLSPYLSRFADQLFPFELVVSSPEKLAALAALQRRLNESRDLGHQVLAGIFEPALREAPSRRFFQMHAPLELLVQALAFNADPQRQGAASVELYIAQSSLPDLPPELQDDLPTPDLVRHAGKGDVYSSSIWLGTEPTYTPLHRDPNPNLFCQLCSHKAVRLMPPALGERLFFEVQVKIRHRGHSRIRSTEMMEGLEREVLHEAVWENEQLPDDVCDAELGPGDALFIPVGWWHSVRSLGTNGHLNASVNWWFR